MSTFKVIYLLSAPMLHSVSTWDKRWKGGDRRTKNAIKQQHPSLFQLDGVGFMDQTIP